MSMVLNWVDGRAVKERAKGRALRRAMLLPRLWLRQASRRAMVNRVLAETRDPEILADLGITAPRRGHVERWVAAMLWHQH